MLIEVWSDYACPFCYIGKRHLEVSLESFQNKEAVEIRWHSFQLMPELPKETNISINDLLAKRYGVTVERARQMNEQVNAMAQNAGLNYDFDAMIPTNTFDAHRLSHLAKEKGYQDKFEERFFSAYFVEGKHLGNKDSLRQLGKDIGLQEEDINPVLESDAYAESVNQDYHEGRSLGLTGVPFFVFNRKYGIVGAQPVSVFQKTIEKAWNDESSNQN